jgi:hypothetical protein
VRIKCPVLDIGRNSVMPSTRPRMIASKMDMRALLENRREVYGISSAAVCRSRTRTRVRSAAGLPSTG